MHRNPRGTGESPGSYHALLQSFTKRILMYLHGKEGNLTVTCKKDRVDLLSFKNVNDILKEQHHGINRPYRKNKPKRCSDVVATSNNSASTSSTSTSTSTSFFVHPLCPLLLHLTLEMFHL